MEENSAKQDPMIYILDDRETALQSHWPPESGVAFRRQRLEVGDVALTQGGRVLAIFERKTWADYAASIKDGRNLNREKLEAFSVAEGFAIKTYYILEGPRPKPKDKVSGIAVETIESSIFRLMQFEGFGIMYTDSAADTVRQLILFGVAFCRGKSQGRGVVEHLVRDPLVSAWQSIPGIGRITASALSRDFTLGDVLARQITRDQLEAWRGAGKKLSGKQIDQIMLGPAVKILAEMPGISKTIATRVVQAAMAEAAEAAKSPRSFAGGAGATRSIWQDSAQLAAVPVSAKTRFGTKRAEDLCSWLSKLNKEPSE